MKNRDISRLAFTLANFNIKLRNISEKSHSGLQDFSGDVSRVRRMQLLGNLHRNVAKCRDFSKAV